MPTSLQLRFDQVEGALAGWEAKARRRDEVRWAEVRRLWSESPWQRLHYGFHLPIAMETWGGAQSCVEKRKEMDGDRQREREKERTCARWDRKARESERVARGERWREKEGGRRKRDGWTRDGQDTVRDQDRVGRRSKWSSETITHQQIYRSSIRAVFYMPRDTSQQSRNAYFFKNRLTLKMLLNVLICAAYQIKRNFLRKLTANSQHAC